MGISLYYYRNNKHLIMNLDSYNSIIDSYTLLKNDKRSIYWCYYLELVITPISFIKISLYDEDIKTCYDYKKLINSLFKFINDCKSNLEIDIENSHDIEHLIKTNYSSSYPIYQIKSTSHESYTIERKNRDYYLNYFESKLYLEIKILRWKLKNIALKLQNYNN